MSVEGEATKNRNDIVVFLLFLVIISSCHSYSGVVRVCEEISRCHDSKCSESSFFHHKVPPEYPHLVQTHPAFHCGEENSR